mgnify:CR=1 FL=1
MGDKELEKALEVVTVIGTTAKNWQTVWKITVETTIKILSFAVDTR